ncbi:MAG: hypothetical protein NT027_08105 [Proteobacteria bacterium]|nr:hypothetical protein [Pseudomonadota bacterium]
MSRRNSEKIKYHIFRFLATISAAFAFLGCSPDDSMVDVGKRAPAKEADGESKTAMKEGIDFEKTCGIDTKAGDDAIVFAQTLKSLPIVVQGQQMGANFRVTTTATLQIESKTGKGSQNISVTVDDVKVVGSNPIISLIGQAVAKGKAKKQAEAASGPKQTESLPFGQWMNLVHEKEEFSGLLCAISATKKETDNTEGNAIVEYLPALPKSINPRAPKETLEKEIGDGRSFAVTANVISPKKGWPTGQTQGTVTIKPRSSSFSMSDGTSYASDIAFEVIVDFPVAPGSKVKPSFASHQLFFINNTSKDFEAIVDQSNPVMEDGTKVPAKVMLRTK